MPNFIPGLELSRLFFSEAVKPILDADFPGLRYSAALIHTGSEVLGFDTEMSADHGWGPRVDLFLDDADHDALRAALDDALRHKLPHAFRGYPTSFTAPDPNDNGTQHLEARSSGPVNHKVNVFTPRTFFLNYLAFDITRDIDPAVRTIAARRPIGSVDQFSDSTDLVSHAEWRPALRKLYE